MEAMVLSSDFAQNFQGLEPIALKMLMHVRAVICHILHYFSDAGVADCLCDRATNMAVSNMLFLTHQNTNMENF